MTETPKRNWRKIKYYPVSMKKLKQASMREAAYLIAPMNIGEDYEYFDKVKHLLDIPEPRKSLEEIKQEFDEKIDKLIETTKEKFECSNYFAGKRYNEKFDRIIENFEYAKEHGEFRPKLKLSYTATGLSAGSYETSFVIKQGSNHKGYYTFGNRRYLKYYMPTKPNVIVRFFMKTCLGFYWVDETT